MENIMWSWFRSFQSSASNLRSGALLKTAGRQLASSLSAFPCPKAVSLCGGSPALGPCQGPGGLSCGLGVTLPQRWKPVKPERGFGQDCQLVFLSGLGVNHCLQSLQDANFSGQGCGLPAGQVMMDAIVLWSPFSSPALHQLGNEDAVQSTHSETLPPLL